MTFFVAASDRRIAIERTTRDFVVYGDTLQEVGEAAAAAARTFYGSVPFRISHLDVREARFTSDKRLAGTAYTETI